MYEVRVSAGLAELVARRWGRERSGTGRPSEYDFWSGPLVAARAAFAEFESLPSDPVPEVRALIVVDAVFGPLVFVGVLVSERVVELVSVETDPDYWEMIGDDPDE